MGRARRPTPKLLAEKLLTIRKYLHITQEQMVERLDYEETPLFPGHISEYERGLREPPLVVLLRYARLVRVPMETLVDDESKLPANIRRGARLSEETYELEERAVRRGLEVVRAYAAKEKDEDKD